MSGAPGTRVSGDGAGAPHKVFARGETLPQGEFISPEEDKTGSPGNEVFWGSGTEDPGRIFAVSRGPAPAEAGRV